jgi:ATP-dependent Clp protease ATP-binding subunit ClpA
VFERFTEPARQAIVWSQQEAAELRHNYIGTEHILLGLLREKEGVAARVLETLGITIEEVRTQVAGIIGQGDEAPRGQIPFTPRAKRVLELALQESLALGHNHIGSEHVLLGLARENNGVAARILLDFDAEASKIRGEVFRELGTAPPAGYEDAMARRRRTTALIDDAEADEAEAIATWPYVLAKLAILCAAALGLGVLIGWAIWG